MSKLSAEPDPNIVRIRCGRRAQKQGAKEHLGPSTPSARCHRQSRLGETRGFRTSTSAQSPERQTLKLEPSMLNANHNRLPPDTPPEIIKAALVAGMRIVMPQPQPPQPPQPSMPGEQNLQIPMGTQMGGLVPWPHSNLILVSVELLTTTRSTPAA